MKNIKSMILSSVDLREVLGLTDEELSTMVVFENARVKAEFRSYDRYEYCNASIYLQNGDKKQFVATVKVNPTRCQYWQMPFVQLETDVLDGLYLCYIPKSFEDKSGNSIDYVSAYMLYDMGGVFVPIDLQIKKSTLAILRICSNSVKVVDGSLREDKKVDVK